MKSSLFRWSLLSCSVFALGGTPAAHAEWASDPADNLVLSDVAGSTEPKIAATPDGGFYVSWLDGMGSGYDLRLQRLDAQGNELWAHGGILVLDRDFSFNYDYGLAVDAAGNAWLSLNCCVQGEDEHIAISKVAPDGTVAWGATGMDVSGTSEGTYNAYVTAAEDDRVVVAWSSDNGVRAQKLDADGTPQWAAGGVLIDDPSGLKLLGGVVADADGNAIVSWNNQPTFTTRILMGQKLASADGGPLWNDGSGLRIFDEGNLQAGYYPPPIADGAGGAVFFDYDLVGVNWVPRVQRVDATGNRLFGANGTLGTTEAGHDHVGTSATFDPASGDIYLLWTDTWIEDMQDWESVSAQRIDASGQRAWGDTGKLLVPPANATDGTSVVSQLVALPAPDGFIASWVTGANPGIDQPLRAARLDAAGEFVWETPVVTVKSARSTGYLAGAASVDGFLAWAWQDGEESASTLRAQNLNLDGTLGPIGEDDVIFADGFDGIAPPVL
ncbi:MAG: hypothetical protein J0H15_09375 [Xanthomonadales bacterium]|nr:hypothetical protein [Xanthomonadales bacterium]